MKIFALNLVLSSFLLPSLVESLQVAVIGTTGNIGSTIIKELSKQNIPTRCLLRHEISDVPIKDNPSTSDEVAAYLASLNNVEMIKGDVTDPSSIRELIKGCDVVMAMQGPPKPNPLLSIIPFLSDQNAPSHPFMINYIGIKNIIEAVRETPSVGRIVRISGSGEKPFSPFTILLNMLGNMAKGWNYEGEQLLRQSGLDYTIVRPGLLQDSTVYTEPKAARALKDNGGDMKVTLVTFDQIAELCLECIKFDSTKKSTLTVMNVEENEGEESYTNLLEKVEQDKRHFEGSLIDQHRKGTRIGVSILLLFSGVFLKVLLGIFSFFM